MNIYGYTKCKRFAFQVSYSGPIIFNIVSSLFHSSFGLWRLRLLSLSRFNLLSHWFFVVFNFYIIGSWCRFFVFLWFSLSLLFRRLWIRLAILSCIIVPRCINLRIFHRIAGSLFHHLNRFGLFTSKLLDGHIDCNIRCHFKDRHLNFLFNRFCNLLNQWLRILLSK